MSEPPDSETTGAEMYLKLGMYLAYQGDARLALRGAVERAPCDGAARALLEQAKASHSMSSEAIGAVERCILARPPLDEHAGEIHDDG